MNFHRFFFFGSTDADAQPTNMTTRSAPRKKRHQRDKQTCSSWARCMRIRCCESFQTSIIQAVRACDCKLQHEKNEKKAIDNEIFRARDFKKSRKLSHIHVPAQKAHTEQIPVGNCNGAITSYYKFTISFWLQRRQQQNKLFSSSLSCSVLIDKLFCYP